MEQDDIVTNEDLALLGIETVEADAIVARLISIGYTLAEEPSDRFYTTELVREGFTALLWPAYAMWCLSINRGKQVAMPYIRIGSPKIVADLPKIVAKHESALLK